MKDVLKKIQEINVEPDGAGLNPQAKEIFDRLTDGRDDLTTPQLYMIQILARQMWLAAMYDAVGDARFNRHGAASFETFSSTGSLVESPLAKSSRQIVREMTALAKELGILEAVKQEAQRGSVLGEQEAQRAPAKVFGDIHVTIPPATIPSRATWDYDQDRVVLRPSSKLSEAF